MRGRIFLLGAIVFFGTVVESNFVKAAQSRLDKIHLELSEKYQSVNHLSATEFESIKSSELILFDVRQQNEYDVSHISDAVRVDPDINFADFADKYSELLGGKTAVFYCSVGRRSSKLISSLRHVFKEGDALAYNLKGGIFEWHNNELPLVNLLREKTTIIHPYNFYWGRLIENRSAIRYKPPPKGQYSDNSGL